MESLEAEVKAAKPNYIARLVESPECELIPVVGLGVAINDIEQRKPSYLRASLSGCVFALYHTACLGGAAYGMALLLSQK